MDFSALFRFEKSIHMVYGNVDFVKVQTYFSYNLYHIELFRINKKFKYDTIT